MENVLETEINIDPFPCRLNNLGFQVMSIQQSFSLDKNEIYLHQKPPAFNNQDIFQ